MVSIETPKFQYSQEIEDGFSEYMINRGNGNVNPSSPINDSQDSVALLSQMMQSLVFDSGKCWLRTKRMTYKEYRIRIDVKDFAVLLRRPDSTKN